MNAPLIITEMNKPSSIIISSSAPSLPHYPPPPPHPYFCLFIHVTARERGRGRGPPGRLPRLHCVAAPAREPRAGDAACVLGAPLRLRVCVHVRGRARCFSAHVARVLVSECVNTSVLVRQNGCDPVGGCAVSAGLSACVGVHRL